MHPVPALPNALSPRPEMPGDGAKAAEAREAPGDDVELHAAGSGQESRCCACGERTSRTLNRALPRRINLRRQSMTKDTKEDSGISRRGLLGSTAKMAGAAGLVGAAAGAAGSGLIGSALGQPRPVAAP